MSILTYASESRRFVRGLVAAAALATTLIALAVTAMVPPAAPRGPSGDGKPANPLVVAIEMPHVEPTVPEGPHRDRFIGSCVICHSARLVLGQPDFPESKWTEIVHKMVAAYDAPIAPSAEREIVAYLVAIKGK